MFLGLGALCLATAGPALAIEWPVGAGTPGRTLASLSSAQRVEVIARRAAQGGQEASGLLLAALEDPDEIVRIAAADQCGRLRLRGAQAPLLRWLELSSAPVRVAAIRALSLLADRSALAQVTRMLSDRDRAVKLAAIDAVVALGGRDSVVSLLDRLGDEETEVRIAAARALGELGDPRAVLSLLGVLNDPTPEVREVVATALGRLGDERGMRPLVSALRDPHQETRVAAARALGAIGSANALTDLAPAALATDSIGDQAQRVELARAAVASIGRIGGDEAARLLVRVLRNGGAQEIARAAVDALRLPNVEWHAALGALIVEPLPLSARDATSELLGDLGGDDAAQALLQLSVQSRPANENAWLLALGRTGSVRALHALLRIAVQPVVASSQRTSLGVIPTSQPSYRPGIYLALREWSSRVGRLEAEALDPLLTMLRQAQQHNATQTLSARSSSGPSHRDHPVAAVVELIGMTHNVRAATVLVALLADPQPSIRIAASRALTLVGVEGVERQLVTALADSHEEVRSGAADALARHGGPLAVDLLIRALEGDRPIDRGSAFFALGRMVGRNRRVDVAPLLVRELGRARPDVAAAVLDALVATASLGDDESISAIRSKFAANGPFQSAALEALSNALATSEGAAHVTLTRVMAEVITETATDAHRAASLWSQQFRQGEVSWGPLVLAVRDPRDALAINALGATARLLRTNRAAPEGVFTAACESLRSRSAPRVANALAVLARGDAQCGNVEAQRLVTEARSPWVRRMAASLVARQLGSENAGTARLLLGRCAVSDTVPTIRDGCRALLRQAPASRESQSTIAALDALVLAQDETTPTQGAPYVLWFADGIARVGTTGLTGWIHERAAPAGRYSIEDPARMPNER